MLTPLATSKGSEQRRDAASRNILEKRIPAELNKIKLVLHPPPALGTASSIPSSGANFPIGTGCRICAGTHNSFLAGHTGGSCSRGSCAAVPPRFAAVRPGFFRRTQLRRVPDHK